MVESSRRTIAEITAHCRGRFAGTAQEAARPIRTVSTLLDATADDVSWIMDPKFASDMRQSNAAAIIGKESLLGNHPRGIFVEDPSLAVAQVLDLFWTPPHMPAAGVHPSAVVDPSVVLGRNVSVGALTVIGPDSRIDDDTIVHEGVSIGAGVHIGRGCTLYDRCVIYDRCTVGNQVILHAGVVIGADGFGYIFREGRHRRIPHIGTVFIEDDVEIGANSCIDRAKIGATVIGRGTKIDNMVQVAHNVRIGPLCAIAAQVGLAGSVRIGSGVLVGGQAGVADGITIGDAARIGAQCGVIRGHVQPGAVLFGTPAGKSTEVFRLEARIRKLPKLFDEVAELARRMAKLEAATHHSEHG